MKTTSLMCLHPANDDASTISNSSGALSKAVSVFNNK